MRTRNAVLVGPIVPNRIGSGDETLAVGLSRDIRQSIHGRGLVQDEYRAALVLFREYGNDFVARPGKVDVPNIDVVTQFGEVREDPSDLGAVGAIVGGPSPVDKVFFQQE